MKKTIKVLAPVAAAVALSSVSYAATTTVSGSTAVISTDFPNNTVVQVPGTSAVAQCAPGASTVLNSTLVKLTANLSSQGQLTNPQSNTQPLTGNVTVTGPFTLTLPNSATLVATPAINFASVTVSPGATVTLPQTGNQATASGSGGVNGWTGATISLPISTKVSSSIGGGGGGQLTISLQTVGLAQVDVTYDTTPCVVPEPKVYGAIGALLSLGLLGFRHYRAKKA